MDGVELLSLVDVPAHATTDGETVTITGGTTYGVVAAWLEQRGLALHNMGSLPHISVAGATSTATHGSGTSLGNLATAIRALEFVTPSGELETIAYGHPDFAGAAVALGALGPITRVTLAVQPSYRVRQDVYLGLGWDALLAHPVEVFAVGYSVSVFTDWVSDAMRVWVKTRMDAGASVPDEIFGAERDTRKRQILAGEDNVTVQGGVPGPWSERLPHFRVDATPSNGDEIQSEYLVSWRMRWRHCGRSVPSRRESLLPCWSPSCGRLPPTNSGCRRRPLATLSASISPGRTCPQRCRRSCRSSRPHSPPFGPARTGERCTG
jgi:xylitol oxidase